MVNRIRNIAITAVVLAGAISITWWLTANPVKDLTTSEPGLDNRGEGNVFVQEVAIGEIFNELGSSTNQLTEIWPAFRGDTCCASESSRRHKARPKPAVASTMR